MDEDDEEREEEEEAEAEVFYTTTSTLTLRGNKKRFRSIQHDEDDIQEDRFVRGRAEEMIDIEGGKIVGGEEAVATTPKLGVRNNAATIATGVDSDELEEQRRKSFFEALEKHTTRKGITLPPLRLGKEDNVDLFELFVAVCLKGGFKGVAWSEIAALLRLPPTINNAEIALKTFYAKYLYPFEIEVRLDSTAMDELADPSTIQLGSTTINLMLLLESTMFGRSIAYQQQFKQPRPTRTPEHRQQQKLIAALGSGNETYIEWALNTLCQRSYVSDEMRLTTPVLLDHISVFIEKELTILETTPSSSIDYGRHLERATQFFKVINNLSCVTSNSIAMASHVPTMQMLLEVLSLRSSCTSSEEKGLTGLLQNALEALVNVATHSSANELWLEYLDSLIHLLDSEFDDKKIDFIACELFYKLSLHDSNEFIFASISDTFLDVMLRFLEYKCLSTLPSSACVIRHNHQPSSCCTLPSHLGLLSLALLFNLSSHATLQKRLANHPNCLRRLIHLLQMVDEDTASDPVRLDLSKRAAFILFNISSNSETAELLSQFENELACVSISKHPYNRIALKILHQIQIT